MPDGGHFFVSAESIEVTGDEVPGLEPGNFIKLSFRDEGTGISEENLERIFDPYFTTKRSGHGLGLAVTFAIVRKHGGYIRASSAVGAGATFELYLPGSDGCEPPETSVVPQSKTTSNMPERVLVMDDEYLIVAGIQGALLESGCSVIAATNGAEAIEKHRESLAEGNPFGCIILDLTVPGEVGGRAVAAAVLETQPNARILVSSGHAASEVMASPSDYGIVGALAKPYTADELREAVRRAALGGFID